MNNHNFKAKFISLMPYFFLALLIIAAYRISGELGTLLTFLRWGWVVIAPFFYGFLLAYVINIPCSSIQKLLQKSHNGFLVKYKKSISLVTVLFIAALFVFLALNMVIPAIVESIAFFITHVPDYWESVVAFIDYFNNIEFLDWQISTDEISSLIMGMVGFISVDNLLAPLNALMGAAAAIFRGMIAFISSIYIMIEKEKCKAYINKLLLIFTSDKFRITFIQIFASLNKNLRQYIHTQTIGGLILGSMSAVALFFMGSPYALILGILLWFANYIPYFGSIIATVVAILVVTFTQGLTLGLVAAGVLLVIQQIEVNIIQPKLVSGAFSISPLLVIISITVGGAIAGILGMMVIIPIVAVLKDMFDGLVAHYERKKTEVVEDFEE